MPEMLEQELIDLVHARGYRECAFEMLIDTFRLNKKPKHFYSYLSAFCERNNFSWAIDSKLNIALIIDVRFEFIGYSEVENA